VRGHWRSENSLHTVRDVTFGDDRSRLRSDDASQVMAAVRTLAMTLLHHHDSFQIAAARRHVASCPHDAFLWLLAPSLPPF